VNCKEAYFFAERPQSPIPLAFGIPPAREAESAGGMPKVPKGRDWVDWSVGIYSFVLLLLLRPFFSLILMSPHLASATKPVRIKMPRIVPMSPSIYFCCYVSYLSKRERNVFHQGGSQNISAPTEDINKPISISTGFGDSARLLFGLPGL